MIENESKKTDKVVRDFKDNLFKRLGPASLKATQDYRNTMKYTGGYLSESMVVAYSAGVHKMLNILLKELTNEEIENKDSASA